MTTQNKDLLVEVAHMRKVAQLLLDKPTNEEAFEAGYSCGMYGARDYNCHYRFFSLPDLTRAWEQGRAAAMKDKRR